MRDSDSHLTNFMEGLDNILCKGLSGAVETGPEIEVTEVKPRVPSNVYLL